MTRLEKIKAQHVEHDMSDSDDFYLLGLLLTCTEALHEARKWIGDGEYSDGLAREHWTPEYAALVDKVDAALAPNPSDTEPK